MFKRMKNWPASKWIWFAIIFTVLVYLAGVGLLIVLRSLGLFRPPTTAEMFYGPAITISGGWLIFGAVQLLLSRRKNGRHNRVSGSD
jgi:hypothetical protein